MSDSKLIDAHCHLDFKTFDLDRLQVLQRAADINISDIIIPGTQKKYWQRIRSLCATHDNLHACYGLHPYWVKQHELQDIAELRHYIKTSSTVALGECGLDFRPQQADKSLQLEFFEAQLTIAEEYQLPVVIHSVKATETVIQTLKKYQNLTGMIHSYSGSLEQAKQLIDLNFFISIGGSVTYERANKIKKVAAGIPLTSLLVETDAPDQPDFLHSDKRNEPAFLINTVAAIAAIRKSDSAEISRQTTINAKHLFKL